MTPQILYGSHERPFFIPYSQAISHLTLCSLQPRSAQTNSPLDLAPEVTVASPLVVSWRTIAEPPFG